MVLSGPPTRRTDSGETTHSPGANPSLSRWAGKYKIKASPPQCPSTGPYPNLAGMGSARISFLMEVGGASATTRVPARSGAELNTPCVEGSSGQRFLPIYKWGVRQLTDGSEAAHSPHRLSAGSA